MCFALHCRAAAGRSSKPRARTWNRQWGVQPSSRLGRTALQVSFHCKCPRNGQIWSQGAWHHPSIVLKIHSPKVKLHALHWLWHNDSWWLTQSNGAGMYITDDELLLVQWICIHGATSDSIIMNQALPNVDWIAAFCQYKGKDYDDCWRTPEISNSRHCQRTEETS